MKILNNKKVNLVGKIVTCSHCGAELEIESSDKICCIPDCVHKGSVEKYNDDLRIIKKLRGDLYYIKCASCGEIIGFIGYSSYKLENASVVNPHKYWVNQDDGGWYVVDILQSIKNELYNRGKYTHEHKHHCRAIKTSEMEYHGRKINVYNDNNDVLEEVKKEYPDVTENDYDVAYALRCVENENAVGKSNSNNYRYIDDTVKLDIKTLYNYETETGN